MAAKGGEMNLHERLRLVAEDHARWRAVREKARLERERVQYLKALNAYERRQA